MDLTAEWLEADAYGGFASGTVGGERTRRYHALLLVATRSPDGRIVLVNGIEAWIERPAGRHALTTQRYAPDVLYPEGSHYLTGFSHQPWPSWRFVLPSGLEIVHELFVARETSETVLRWWVAGAAGPCRLTVRPLVSGRDYHALHQENPTYDFGSAVDGRAVAWQPYAPLPKIVALSNGDYSTDPDWYRRFLYTAEGDRGLDCVEDLASPGRFEFDLEQGRAVLIFHANNALARDAEQHAEALAARERRRRASETNPLFASAASYVIDGSRGKTLLAGFPWFTDWGRDTFIAMRGLVLAAGRLAQADAILLAWASL